MIKEFSIKTKIFIYKFLNLLYTTENQFDKFYKFV